MIKNEAINDLMIERVVTDLEHEHYNSAFDTPLRPDAFELDDETKMELIAKHFTAIMEALGMNLEDDSLKDTPKRVAKMYVKEIFSGYSISQYEQAAFMHIWAVVGYLSGLNEGLIPENSKMARQLDTIIKRRQFTVSTHGQELTRSLTAHMLSVNKSKATANDILGLMRYLLGKDIANMLAIDAPELPAYKLPLIKTLNLLKSFKPQGDARQNYRTAYTTFKLQNPELAKRN